MRAEKNVADDNSHIMVEPTINSLRANHKVPEMTRERSYNEYHELPRDSIDSALRRQKKWILLITEKSVSTLQNSHESIIF